LTDWIVEKPKRKSKFGQPYLRGENVTLETSLAANGRVSVIITRSGALLVFPHEKPQN